MGARRAPLARVETVAEAEDVEARKALKGRRRFDDLDIRMRRDAGGGGLAHAAAPVAAAAGAAATAGGVRGSRIVNSVNSPSRLSTAIVPPCSWTTMS